MQVCDCGWLRWSMALMVVAKMNALHVRSSVSGEMNALHALGESTTSASGFGCAGACCAVRVVVTQAAPVSRAQEAKAITA
jgi:hypothetical protein